MDIELSKAVAYEQLKPFLSNLDFDKRNFPTVYSRDWFLCFEVLNPDGKLFDLVTVLQKQGSRLLLALLDVESSLEVFGEFSEPYKSSYVDAQNELAELERLISGGSLNHEGTAPKKGRRESQFEIIRSVIKELGYDPQKIPENETVKGKQEIFRKCYEISPALFSKDSFNHAWKIGAKNQLFQIEGIERFTKGRKRP